MYVRVAPEPDNVPCAGDVTTVYDKASASGSVPDNVIAVAVSSAVVTACGLAVGVRLLATIVVDAVPLPLSSSVTVTTTERVPGVA